MDSSSLLKSALGALNGGIPGPPFGSFDAVNSWLNEFRQTHDAWMACIRVYKESESLSIKTSCASLLVRKVQHDWTGLQSLDEKATYRNVFLQMYAAEISSNTTDILLIRQLVLLLVLSVDTSQEMMHLLQGASASLGEQQVPMAVYASMEMLLTLAVELREGTRRAHAALLPALREKSPQILGLLEEEMVRQNHHADPSRLCCVIRAWIELPSIPGGYSESDIVHFSDQHPRMFEFLLECCFDRGLEAARDSVLVLLKGTSVDEDSVPDDFLKMFQHMSSIIIRYRDSILSENGVTDAQALVIAHVGSALADCWPDGIAKSMGPQCVDFATVMVGCMKRRDAHVVEAALEYFFAMNLIDLKNRAEELQFPLIIHLVQTLRERLMYPSQGDVGYLQDDDQHTRLRNDLIPELLQELFPALALWYVEFAVTGLKMDAWQHIEISLYLLQSVDLQIRTQVLGDPGSGHAASINAMLSDGFRTVSYWMTTLVKREDNSPTSIVVSQFCRTIHSFAIWFGKNNDAPLEEVFSTLMTINSLPVSGLDPECKQMTCQAVKSLSIRAGDRIRRDEGLIVSLLGSLKVVLALRVPGEGDLVEAAIRLASRLEPEIFKDWLVQILRPYAETLVQLCSVESFRISEDGATVAIENLVIMSRGFRCLLSPIKSNDEHTVATFLFQNLHQTLECMVLSHWGTYPEILDGIIGVCKEAVTVGGRAILEGVFAVLSETFKSGIPPSASLFDLLSEMIEVHYSDQESMNGILLISEAAFEHSFSILHNTGVSSQPTMVAGLLGLGYSSLVYVPSRLLESFPTCIDLGIAALACRESPELIVHALEFLAYVPCATTDETVTDEIRRRIELTIIEKGEHLMEALLYALCETCPRSNINSVSNLIKSLMTHEPFIEPSKQWLYGALRSPRVIKSSQILDDTLRANILTVATSGSLRPQRLGCMIQDLGLVSRKEEDLDSLASYMYN